MRGSGPSGTKWAHRCVGHSHEVVGFNTSSPKAMRGLGPLPGTLARRSIPIALKARRPADVYKDFDDEDAVTDAEPLTIGLQA